MAVAFPEDFKKVDPREAEDDATDTDDVSDKMSIGTCTAANVPIVLDSQFLKCKLCLAKCTDFTPLAGFPPGTLIQWVQYRKTADKKSKTMKGRMCAICRNTFRALGWEDEFKSPDKYHKTIGTRMARRGTNNSCDRGRDGLKITTRIPPGPG